METFDYFYFIFFAMSHFFKSSQMVTYVSKGQQQHKFPYTQYVSMVIT